MAAVREMGDVIVKPLFGSMGHGMVRVSDPETAFRVFRALEMTRAVFYVQRVVEHTGCDIRAFVVGDRVVAAIERRATDGGWRTNVSLGGDARAIDLTPAMVGARAHCRPRSRSRLCRRRSPSRSRRNRVRARGQRNSGLVRRPERHIR